MANFVSNQKRPSPREADLQSRCRTWAKTTYGIDSLKLTNKVGVPDCLFYSKSRVLFVEFKILSAHSRPIQTFVQDQIKAQGFQVEVVDDVLKFKKIIEEAYGET
jgi:hypothetical protein